MIVKMTAMPKKIAQIIAKAIKPPAKLWRRPDRKGIQSI